MFYYPQVDCIIFHKTGKLTIGKPTVINTKLMENMILHNFYEIVVATEVGPASLFLDFLIGSICLS